MAVDRDEVLEKLGELLDEHDAKKVKVKVKNEAGERFDFEVRDDEDDEDDEE